MDLNLWTHPKTKAKRLYLSKSLCSKLPHILGENSVRTWFEPATSHPNGWQLKSQNEVGSTIAVDPANVLHVLETLGTSPKAAWEDLIKISEAPKKRASTAGARGRHSPQPTSNRASEALALDVESIKMPGPVTIRVDFREPDEITQVLQSHPLITVERVSLDLGDMEIEDRDGDRLVIERKRCDDTHTKNDFEASVQVDGRLFDQSERLKMAAGASEKQIIPIFILEGDVYGNSGTMLCQQIDGAISFLASVQRVNVLPTYNTNHTAYVIAKLASHFFDGLYKPVSLHKAKPKAVFEQKRYILESIPGVSAKLAEVLLTQFGSVRRVMAASAEELKAVPGLGPKKIEGILQALGDV